MLPLVQMHDFFPLSASRIEDGNCLAFGRILKERSQLLLGHAEHLLSGC